MATCKTCGLRQAAVKSDLCDQCASDMTRAAPGGYSSQESDSGPSWEADITVTLGKVLIWLSIVSSVICVFVYGRVLIPDGLYGTETVWSSTLVTAFIAAGLNGVLLGFLLSKVGSVLKHLEQLRKRS